ncbi:MAG: DUF1161 domain-containing protein [Dokdonella sp.]|nr:DUF1161 domain-containing protein [Dokdonella sp.]MCB1576282.1 DUF1161 domain-containing protein [Xanthomonadales bacterium]
MKALLLLALIAPVIAGAQAPAARKPCDELKSEIAAKIEKNGVRAYALEIVSADAQTEAKIVGSCNGGQQRITYRRGETLTAEAAGPQVATTLR